MGISAEGTNHQRALLKAMLKKVEENILDPLFSGSAKFPKLNCFCLGLVLSLHQRPCKSCSLTNRQTKQNHNRLCRGDWWWWPGESGSRGFEVGIYLLSRCNKNLFPGKKIYISSLHPFCIHYVCLPQCSHMLDEQNSRQENISAAVLWNMYGGGGFMHLLWICQKQISRGQKKSPAFFYLHRRN